MYLADLLFPSILDSRETSYNRELSQKPLNQHLEKNIPHINANFGFKRLTNKILFIKCLQLLNVRIYFNAEEIGCHLVAAVSSHPFER